MSLMWPKFLYGLASRLTSEHPFTVLEARGKRATQLRIRYGFECEKVPPSPLAQVVWHTPAQMQSRMRISKGTVRAVVEAWSSGFTPRGYPYPTPPRTPSIDLSPSPNSLQSSPTSSEFYP